MDFCSLLNIKATPVYTDVSDQDDLGLYEAEWQFNDKNVTATLTRQDQIYFHVSFFAVPSYYRENLVECSEEGAEALKPILALIT